MAPDSIKQPPPTTEDLRAEPAPCLRAVPREGVCRLPTGHEGPCVPFDRRASPREIEGKQS